MSNKLRLGASVVGGLIGALNPAMFVFSPSYAKYIQSKFDFNYTVYATTVFTLFFSLLFLPALLSTFSIYPWLYAEQHKMTEAKDSPKFIKHIKLGTLFGCMATPATALFFLVEAIIFNFFQGQLYSVGTIIGLLFGGTLLISLIGLIMFLPMIVITGSIFAWGNYKIIK